MKLPMEIALDLGIEINPREPASFRGISGHQAKGFCGQDVGFELRQAKKSYRWSVAKVACLYDPPDASDEDLITITLGQVGFFRFFHVTFDSQRARVKIRPNGLFRHRPA